MQVEMRNLDPEKLWHLLISLLAEQEGAEIDYTLEKTAWGGREGTSMKRVMYWMDNSDLGLLIQAGLLIGVIIASYVVLSVAV